MSCVLTKPLFAKRAQLLALWTLLANAREYPSVAEAVADCSLVVGTSAGSRKRDAQHDIHRLEAGAPLIQQTLKQNRTAVLFGSEKFGLSNDDLSHCDWLMYIPARDEHPSMNLGQAVALCLYELIQRWRPTQSGAGSSQRSGKRRAGRAIDECRA